MPTPVITRFAPSPTGFLHIGGARTALFNWLYAKARGGRMLLRIEDTDRDRSKPEAVAAIIEGLVWLGLDWDGEPVSQHANAARHGQVVADMLKQGKAYKCYCTPEDIQAMRDRARQAGKPAVYDGTCRDHEATDANKDATFVVRFRSLDEGSTIIEDRVQGPVKFANDNLDDLILLRSDGSPTYMLSVVVDDHDMGVTHIVRGDDHLTNAARQAQIYDGLGWACPEFAHIPLIHGPDGAKLSKRHGALAIGAYRDMGFLPDALRNYLARLGWSHGDDEIISTEQLIEWFDLDGINKGAARFDMAKLEHLNGQYLRNRDDGQLALEFITYMADYAPNSQITAHDLERRKTQITMAMPVLKTRASTLADLEEQSRFMFAARPLDIDDHAAKVLDDGARAVLCDILPILTKLDDWDVEALETTIKDFVNTQGLKLGKLAQPLRAALTGTSKSPGIFDVIAILGKDEALARIQDQAMTAK